MAYESKKYKSDALEAAHTAAVGLFSAGEMDAERMRHFDEGCLIDPNKDATVRIHPVTGKVLCRGIRSLTFTYKTESITLDILGWYPDDDSDGIVNSDDTKEVDEWLIQTKTRFNEDRRKES